MDEYKAETHRGLNPYRVPKSDKMQAIVDDVIYQIQAYEKHRKKRQRKRSIRNQNHFEKTITAIVCDLTYEHLVHPGAKVMIPRTKEVLGQNKPGKPEIYTEALTGILDALSAPEMIFIDQIIGNQYFAFRTVITAGERLIMRIDEHGVTLDDFGIEDLDEVIYLKEPKESYWHDPKCISYKDTKFIRQCRAEMREINTWIRNVDIKCVLTQNHFNGTQRRLVRSFTQKSFKSGGRLFGGFWENMPKEERKSYIRIDGELIVHLDYDQMMPRLLYAIADEPAPKTDMYAIPGFDCEKKEVRKGLKTIMSAMQFRRKPFQRFPQGTRSAFSADLKITDVSKAIEEAHTPIKHLFFKNKGHSMQFHESQILVQVLLELKSRNVVALPLHDCVIVPKSKMAIAEEVMKQAFLDRMGQGITVSVE